MTVKLSVSRPGPQPWHNEYAFDQDVITIGRSARCDLQLEGVNSVVSREHAKIIRKQDSYVVVDLNSTNTTLLNGTMLRPNIETALHPGDRFHICDYDIEFLIEAEGPAEEPSPEPPPPPRPNPFAEDLAALAQLLDQVALLYDIDQSPQKNEEMHQALQEALKGSRGKKAGEMIADYLSAGRTLPTVAMSGKAGSELDILSNYERIGNLIDTLFVFMTKLIQARVKFRQEFLNETIIKSKSFSFDGSTPEDLKAYLFDAGLTPEEGQTRTEALAAVLEELLLHQLSLLEGYKSAVNEGSKRFLERMSPDRLKEQLAEKRIRLGVVNVPAKSVPVLRLVKLLQIQAEAYRELASEDQSVIEERYFRPSYKRSYYNCTRASRRKPSKSEK